MQHMLFSHRLLAGIAAISLNVQAAEWAAEPAITVRGEYNDNIRLTSAPHDDVWGAILEPRVTFARRTERWDMSANARLRAAYYDGEDNLNTTDNFFDIKSKQRFERGSWDASASLANDTTLQNEFLDLDTGIVVSQIDRTRHNFRLAGQYMFTETVWMEASLGYQTVKYDDGERFGLLDYDYLTPSLQVVHQFNPKIQLFGVLSHSRVSYDSASELESKTNSLQLGGAYDITETWKLSGSVGNRRTRTSSLVPTAVPRPGLEFLFPLVYDVITVPRDSESTGLVYNASLSRKFETGDLGLNASRSVVPSSTGTDTDTTSVSLNGSHRFSETFSGRLSISYLQSETVGDARTIADNDRYRIAPGLTWRLDRDLHLTAGYIYTQVMRGSTGANDAESNAAFVSLGYTWPRAAISR